MKNVIRSSLCLLLLFCSLGTSPAAAQSSNTPIFEKAKTALVATVQQEETLRQAPDPAGKNLMELPKGAQVLISGRMGTWLQVEVNRGNSKSIGWLPSSALKVQGPVTPLPPPVATPVQEPAPPIATSVERSPSRTTPVRLIPNVGFGYGAKQFPNQIRFGSDLLFQVSKATEAGFSVQGGFRSFLLIGGGPVIVQRLSWPRLGPLRTSLFAGFSGFLATSSSKNEIYAGPRVGADFSYSLLGIGTGEIEWIFRGEADVLMFGAKSVLIPIVGSTGIAIHF